MLPLITGHYYYSRYAQIANTASARIFTFLLPEREFKIREISHNTAFATPLLIGPVTSGETDDSNAFETFAIFNITFSVAKELHRINEFSEFERDFKFVNAQSIVTNRCLFWKKM